MEPTVKFKSSKKGRRRVRTADDDEEDGTVAVDVPVKKAGKRSGMRTAAEASGRGADVGAAYAGAGELKGVDDVGATRVLQEETEKHLDRRAQREAFMSNDNKVDDGKYRGMRGYMDWRGGLRQEAKVPVYGPQRISTAVRTTIRVDYQPDVCKDWKETGFCSYGDTCKFLHDRGDYKAGWQLDKDWEEEQAAKREAAQRRLLEGKDPEASSSGSDDDEDGLPFACCECRRPWQECDSDPVKTRCGHYFCEGCVLKGGKRCAVCGLETLGIYNAAADITRKFDLKALRNKAARRVPQLTGWSVEAADEGTDVPTGDAAAASSHGGLFNRPIALVDTSNTPG